MLSDIDAETFYMHQRAIAEIWGYYLLPWEELSWEDRLAWEDKLNEQRRRDTDEQ